MTLPQFWKIHILKSDTCLQCTAAHEGRLLINEVVPIHIDQLFLLMFTRSKFYLDFHAGRNNTGFTETPWSHNPEDNTKKRVVNLTVAINPIIGPKTSQITETQLMLPCSKAGNLYSINVRYMNAGVPYADGFYVSTHYCLQKISENQSSISVYAQIKFKKSMWGLVRGMIQRSVLLELKDFYGNLSKALHAEGGVKHTKC